ncbi:hypothetical protein acdb102_21240 [Acidothermaceae bacterium B102]|nr:hypothetical protein acdb102_21240 [Acidothermaceae bacterium B102]
MAQLAGRAMTLIVPSFLAAVTSAGRPPRSAADVALLASEVVAAPPEDAAPEVAAAAPEVAAAAPEVAAAAAEVAAEEAAVEPELELEPQAAVNRPRDSSPAVSEIALVFAAVTLVPSCFRLERRAVPGDERPGRSWVTPGAEFCRAVRFKT